MVLSFHIKTKGNRRDGTWSCLGLTHNGTFSGMHTVGPWTAHGKKLTCQRSFINQNHIKHGTVPKDKLRAIPVIAD